jgi:signal transduction histidine kinase
MRVVLSILFVFAIFLSAKEIDIVERVYVDTSSSMSIKDAIKNKDKFKTVKKYNMGLVKDDVWIYLQIKNNTNKKITKKVLNKRFGLDFVDVYILKDNKIATTYKLGDMTPHSQRDNHFRASYFDLTLQGSESIEIIIKQKSCSTMEVEWHLLDVDEFNSFFSRHSMIYFSVMGMVLVVIVVSFMLYFLLKSKYYLIYALFAISSIIYQFSLAGFLYEFGMPLYPNVITSYSVSLIGMILLSIFPFSFLQLKRGEYPILTTIIKACIVVFVVVAIGYLFYPLHFDLLYNVQYSNIASFIVIVTLLILSFRAFLDKKRGAIYYLIANMFLSSFSLYFIICMFGLIPTSTMFYYAISIGIVGQDFFLALALISATYSIKKDSDKSKELVDEYSKLSFLGQTVINIYHQWKAPVKNIYNSINHIEVAKEFGDEDLDKIINENLVQIKNNTEYLKDTALNYLGHYKQIDKPATNINLYSEINSVVKLIKLESEKINLEINVDCKKDIELHLRQNHFTNLLMILIENAIEVFRIKGIKNPLINIEVEDNKNQTILKISDNAGGIDGKNINDIFDKNHSASSSSGIGLYLAKDFLMPKLNGDIVATNTKEGACFIVTIDK